jgi:hypothetical protein
MCTFRSSDCENDALHSVHTKGFSPAWVVKCTFSGPDSENDLLHCFAEIVIYGLPCTGVLFPDCTIKSSVLPASLLKYRQIELCFHNLYGQNLLSKLNIKLCCYCAVSFSATFPNWLPSSKILWGFWLARLLWTKQFSILHNMNSTTVCTQLPVNRAWHPILFSVFDIWYSETSKPVLDFDTPILFRILQSDTQYSILYFLKQVIFYQCWTYKKLDRKPAFIFIEWFERHVFQTNFFLIQM